MRDVLKDLNKHSLSNATGISYSRLRKYASNQVKSLTEEEKTLIYNYLVDSANKIKMEVDK